MPAAIRLAAARICSLRIRSVSACLASARSAESSKSGAFSPPPYSCHSSEQSRSTSERSRCASVQHCSLFLPPSLVRMVEDPPGDASARSKPSVSPSWYSDGTSESAASSAFSNWLFSHARYSVTRLSIRMLSISANVLVLSHRFQRFAVRVVQAEPVAVVRVDGDVDAPIVPVDGAFDVGQGEAPLGQVPVAVDGL